MPYPSRRLYLPDALWFDLQTYAKARRKTVSRLVREVVRDLIGETVADPTRNYLPDGEHTAERMEQQAVERILRRIR